MQVTGFMIQNKLRELGHVKELAIAQFDESKMYFPDPSDEPLSFKKPDIVAASEAYKQSEIDISRLQTLQAKYNLAVVVMVGNESMTLLQAIKLVGGAGRGEKMWRGYAKDTGRDRYSSMDRSRSKDHSYAERSLDRVDSAEQAKLWSRYANQIRSAIQIGNSTVVDFTDEEVGSLFD